jgi:hypothetical protein
MEEITLALFYPRAVAPDNSAGPHFYVFLQRFLQIAMDRSEILEYNLDQGQLLRLSFSLRFKEPVV